MASLILLDEPEAFIDYAMSGRIRTFEIDGKTLFDEDEGIDEPGWKDCLVKYIKDHGLNIHDERGLHAFVYKLLEDGDLKEDDIVWEEQEEND